nr:hypothetical protein Iba_chr05cCG6570 [Ipomoea batatas]
MGLRMLCTLLTQVMFEMICLAYSYLALSGNQVLPKIKLSARIFRRKGCRKWLDLLHFQQPLNKNMQSWIISLKSHHCLPIVVHVFLSLMVLQREILDLLVLGLSCELQMEVWFSDYVKVWELQPTMLLNTEV